VAWLTPNDFGTNNGWAATIDPRFSGKLSRRVGFIAQALVVFASVLKSARKGLFYCHPGMLLLQFFQVAGHLGRDLIKLFAAISGVQSGFEAQEVELLAVSELLARLKIVVQSCIEVCRVFVHGVLLFNLVVP
jgi:hypothetical protein